MEGQKRGRGRPVKQKYFTAAEFRAKSEELRKQSQERLGTLDLADAEEGLEAMLDRKRFTTRVELAVG